MNDTLTSPIPIRFSKSTRARVYRVAREYRLPASEIVRRSVEEKLKDWEKGTIEISSQHTK